jgi:hypothetical protein
LFVVSDGHTKWTQPHSTTGNAKQRNNRDFRNSPAREQAMKAEEEDEEEEEEEGDIFKKLLTLCGTPVFINVLSVTHHWYFLEPHKYCG